MEEEEEEEKVFTFFLLFFLCGLDLLDQRGLDIGRNEEAIFYRSMSMRCVCDRYVIYIYIYMMMNVVHNRKVVRSFVRIVVAKLEKITL